MSEATEKTSSKAKRELINLQIEILDKAAILVTTGLGLVAALAWNSAIQKTFDKFFPPEQSGGIWAMFIYAIFITIIVVALTVYLSRTTQRLKDKFGKITKE